MSGYTSFNANFSHRQRHMFALIVGIDSYRSDQIPNLTGAVADALAVCSSISSYAQLHFSAFHTAVLLNEQATKATIIRELQSLKTNERIQRDDPILIYFAGYGSSFAAPRLRSSSPSRDGHGPEKIKTFVPHDCDETVSAISDRTIVACLDDLANIKGDNIVTSLISIALLVGYS